MHRTSIRVRIFNFQGVPLTLTSTSNATAAITRFYFQCFSFLTLGWYGLKTFAGLFSSFWAFFRLALNLVSFCFKITLHWDSLASRLDLRLLIVRLSILDWCLSSLSGTFKASISREVTVPLAAYIWEPLWRASLNDCLSSGCMGTNKLSIMSGRHAWVRAIFGRFSCLAVCEGFG